MFASSFDLAPERKELQLYSSRVRQVLRRMFLTKQSPVLKALNETTSISAKKWEEQIMETAGLVG